MDLRNFYEVTAAIRAIDFNLGQNIENQMIYVREYERQRSFDCHDNALEVQLEKFAIETLLHLKENRRELAYAKSDELYERYVEADDDEKDGACARNNEAFKLADEVEEIEEYLVASFN